MTSQPRAAAQPPSNRRPQQQPSPDPDHRIQPDRRGSRHQRPGRAGPATAATVQLATAARALGISPADAAGLADKDAFPCSVIATTGGYRVPFTALLRLLRTGRAGRGDPPQHHASPAGRDQQR